MINPVFHIRFFYGHPNKTTRQRQQRLELSLEVFEQIEEAQKWWENASAVLCLGDDELTVALLEKMLESSSKLKICDSKKSQFISDRYGNKILSVVQKVTELTDQYKKRMSYLKKEPRPIQPVEPRLADKKSDHLETGLSRSRKSSVENERLVCVPKELTSSDMSEEEKPRIRDALSSSQVVLLIINYDS